MATTAAPSEGGLQHSLQKRHLTMIAIGGVIGAGLFVGSGATIQAAGPAAFLTYAITGVLIVLVMRMLGEMAVANPSTGSFADYSRRALGDWAGFSVGWLYWYFWVIVVGFEAVAGGKLIQDWLPHAPLWLIALLLMLAMTATNLFSVRSYGEFEYWFASVKVAAIVAFLVAGTCYVLGLWPGKKLDFSNLTVHEGFMPHGPGAIFSSIVIVIFSMVGAEIATIAAAESKDPAKAISQATNSVIYRVAIFFVGSIFLIAVIVPWNSPELGTSPYVTAFKTMGIPAADHIMRVVVLTAVLSCLNSAMYTASRMLFVLADRGKRPQLAQGQRARRAGTGHSGVLVHRVRLRHPGVLLRAHRIPVSAQLLRRGNPVRVLDDCHLAICPAPPHTGGEAPRQDVGLPCPDHSDRDRNRRHPGGHGIPGRHPHPAVDKPAVLGRDPAALRDTAVDAAAHPEPGERTTR